MTYRITPLATLNLLTAFVAMPVSVHGQQRAAQAQEQHDHEHPGATITGAPASEPRPGMTSPDMMRMMSDMKAESARLEALVQKMNGAKGAGKTDAIAELLTVLVRDHQKMHESMMSSMPMMQMMMGNMGRPADGAGTPQK